jgi:hypothetical protein
MAITRNRVEDLMWQHEAINSHMKFLTRSMGTLVAQPNQVKISTQLNDQISLCLWSLYDFQEAILRHVELDECIFKTLHVNILMEEITSEHEEIKNRVKDVIRSAESAVSNKLSRPDLGKCALEMSKGINTIRELISSHMAKEDNALK